MFSVFVVSMNTVQVFRLQLFQFHSVLRHKQTLEEREVSLSCNRSFFIFRWIRVLKVSKKVRAVVEKNPEEKWRDRFGLFRKNKASIINFNVTDKFLQK